MLTQPHLHKSLDLSCMQSKSRYVMLRNNINHILSFENAVSNQTVQQIRLGSENIQFHTLQALLQE